MTQVSQKYYNCECGVQKKASRNRGKRLKKKHTYFSGKKYKITSIHFIRWPS